LRRSEAAWRAKAFAAMLVLPPTNHWWWTPSQSRTRSHGRDHSKRLDLHPKAGGILDRTAVLARVVFVARSGSDHGRRGVLPLADEETG
jgi:hypothetical protein